MITLDEYLAKLLELTEAGKDKEAKEYVASRIGEWYTGGDICKDCLAHERMVGEDGIPTGLEVAHDKGCPWFNGVIR